MKRRKVQRGAVFACAEQRSKCALKYEDESSIDSDVEDTRIPIPGDVPQDCVLTKFHPRLEG